MLTKALGRRHCLAWRVVPGNGEVRALWRDSHSIVKLPPACSVELLTQFFKSLPAEIAHDICRTFAPIHLGLYEIPCLA